MIRYVMHALEELANLDFWMRYSIIISNFFIIAMILLHRRRNKSASNQPEVKKNILFVTAHPDDEAMYTYIP